MSCNTSGYNDERHGGWASEICPRATPSVYARHLKIYVERAYMDDLYITRGGVIWKADIDNCYDSVNNMVELYYSTGLMPQQRAMKYDEAVWRSVLYQA